jgi:hypothetical protein
LVEEPGDEGVQEGRPYLKKLKIRETMRKMHATRTVGNSCLNNKIMFSTKKWLRKKSHRQSCQTAVGSREK